LSRGIHCCPKLFNLFAQPASLYCEEYHMSQNPCHTLFLGIPHPQLSKKVPINMGLKVNRSRDIHCCVEIPEILLVIATDWSSPFTGVVDGAYVPGIFGTTDARHLA
jgi:hypothetical protein